MVGLRDQHWDTRGPQWIHEPRRAPYLLAARAVARLCRPDTVEEVRAALPRSPAPPWQRGTGSAATADLTVCLLASLGGWEDEVRATLDALPDRVLAPEYGYYPWRRGGVEAAMCAETPTERVRLARRLAVEPCDPDDIAVWVVGTGATGLDVLAHWVETAPGRVDAVHYLEQAAAILHGPGAVPFFLRMATAARGGEVAVRWLEEHLTALLAADAPPTTSATVERVLRPLGSERLGAAHAEARGTVRRVIDDLLEQERLPRLGDADHPHPDGWPGAGASRGRLPSWVDVSALPPLVVGGARLPADEVAAVVAAAAGVSAGNTTCCV